MTHNKIVKKEDKYYLNDNQYFIIDKQLAKEQLNEIQFPALIMDTEFFNKSHDVNNIEPSIYTDEDPDMVYTLCYSIVNSFKDISHRKNRESISTLSIRKRKGQNLDFVHQRDLMFKKLFNIIIHKQIRTLIFAGEANDIKLMKNWLSKNGNVLNNKVVPLIKKDKSTGEYEINSFDAYKVLTRSLSFSNTKKDGTEFYNPKNLKKGSMGQNTIQIPSLKLFFEYFDDYWKNDDFEEKQGIYELCIDALKLYSQNELTKNEFINLSKSLKQVRLHCRNDVLKLIYLVDFMYHFSSVNDANNVYIKE